MKRTLLYCCLLAAAAPLSVGCTSKESPPGVASGGSGAALDRVKVQHVLIAFRGTGTPATRSKDEAQVLADSVYKRAQGGESFEALMKSSDDGGPGVYTLVTDPQLKNHDKMIFGRSEMVAGFGDTAYSLKVGEVGMCPYDPAKSKFGWHVIKRIE